MASYTRQSSFSDGDTISASLFNNEYNQLVTAFSYSSSGTTGHRHDGTAAEGGNIHTIGDQDFLNKIVVDSSNNRWGVYVQVSGAAVEQIRFQDGSIVPVTSNDIDLGTSSLQFKDLHIDGTANIDSLTLTSGSTVTVILDEDDLTTNSATALATQQSIKAYVDSQVTGQALSFSGDSGGSLSIDLDSEALTITGGTGIDTTGSTNDMSIAIDSTVATLTGSQTLTNKTLTSPDINGGTIDGATIGGSSAGDITYANLSDGTITITAFADEDDMTSNSATLVPTQQSVKAYVDSKVTAEDLDFQADSGGALSIDLDSETMTFTGGTGIDTSGSGNAVTFAIDSTVTTLAGTQTLTNKTLTTPVITSISNSGTVTLPSGTTTLVGTATSDVLTNKTISGSSNTLSNIGNSSLSNSSVSFGGISVALGSSDATPAFDLSDATGYTGDSSLVTTGTISSGVWQGTAVADTYVANDLTISGGTVNNTVIGGSSPAAADFTTVDTTGNATIGGNLAVTGNLTINGTTSTVNSTTVTIDDPIFTLGGDTTPSTDDNKDRGIEFKWHNGTGAKLGFFGYDDSASVFTFIPDASNTSEVFSGSAGNVAFGAISGTSLDISGDIDIDGTANLDVVDIDGAVDFASTTAHAGNATFADNAKAIFGAGSDLQIYHDGSNSWVSDQGTGQLILESGGAGVYIQKGATETMANFVADGSVSLYYDNAKKFETTATGVDVTGNVVSDTLSTNGDVFINNTAGTVSAGYLYSDSDDFVIRSYTSDKDIIFKGNDGGSVIEAMRIDMSAGGNVGIGVTPLSYAKLHISSAGTTAFYADGTQTSDGDIFDFVVRNGTDSVTSIKSIRTGADDAAALAFGTQAAGGSLAERMRIDSAGNLIVSGTAAGQATSVALHNGGYVHAVSSHQMAGIFDRRDSDGDILVFRKDGSGTAVGSIGTEGGDLTIGSSASGHKGVRFGANYIAPINTSNAFEDNTTDLGLPAVRFKDLYMSGIIAKGTGGELDLRSDGGGLNYKQNLDVATAGCTLTGQSTRGDMAAIRLYQTATGADGGYIRFDTCNSGSTTLTEKARLDASGNLLVGTTDTTIYNDNADEYGFMVEPSGQMQLSANNATMLYLNRQNGDGTIVDFRKDGATVGSIGTLNTNRLYFGGADTGIMIASDLDCIYPTNGGDTARNNAVDLGNSGTRFKDLYLSGTANAGSVLKVNSSVDGTEASPHFQIQAAASTYQLNYWLDGTAAYMGQNSALRSLRLYSSAETAGVQLSAGGTSWGTFSDERLKENVEPVENALQSLSGLRTVKYHLKDVDGPEDKKKIGVIAQDLVGVLDEVIDPAFRSDDDTEYMSVRYTELVPVLIKAIQEQQATIEALTARIAALES